MFRVLPLLMFLTLLGAAPAYDGIDPNAPWRAEAQKRINQYRKGDLTITVTDTSGHPVPDATVSIHMTRHAFAFGTCVACAEIMSSSPDSEKYRQTLTQYFNKVVIENELKWPLWEDPARRSMTMAGLQWLKDHNIVVRGHNLVWPSWQWTPHSLQRLKDDKPALRKRIIDHILDEASAVNRFVAEWDVVNEPFSHHDLLDLLGQDVMVDWFKAAKQSDPTAQLFINDFGILSERGQGLRHQDYYFNTIKMLMERGAPVEGIGMQSHFSDDLTPPTRLIEILDRFATLGPMIQSTEFDIEMSNEKLQADYLRDFMTVLFSHPKVQGIVMWGFWEGRHWRPKAALWRKDWSIKPNGQAWLDLVTKQWWTDVEGKSDAKGKYATRGFLGDYEVIAKAGDTSATSKCTLTHDGTKLTVTLK